MTNNQQKRRCAYQALMKAQESTSKPQLKTRPVQERSYLFHSIFQRVAENNETNGKALQEHTCFPLFFLGSKKEFYMPLYYFQPIPCPLREIQ